MSRCRLRSVNFEYSDPCRSWYWHPFQALELFSLIYLTPLQYRSSPSYSPLVKTFALLIISQIYYRYSSFLFIFSFFFSVCISSRLPLDLTISFVWLRLMLSWILNLQSKIFSFRIFTKRLESYLILSLKFLSDGEMPVSYYLLKLLK